MLICNPSSASSRVAPPRPVDTIRPPPRKFYPLAITMERKRKNPPRGASRADHVSKKRTATPPERSETPAPASASASASVSASAPTPTPAPEPVVEEPQLPKSIQPGNPLPTVENAQPDDLSTKEYQSIQER
jgi:hypothetical protein